MDKCIKLKHCIILFAFYLILELLLFIKFNVPLFFDIYIIHTSLFYSSIFICVYNNVRILKKPFEYLESYGKCGLTNYCMQGYFAVIFLCHLGFSYTEHSFSFYIFVTLSFFLLQSILSYLWLKSYRNGPFEYIWRCLTVFKMLPFKRNYE